MRHHRLFPKKINLAVGEVASFAIFADRL
jgi:hypothetical protein